MKNYAWALYGTVLVLLMILGFLQVISTGKGIFVGLVSIAFTIAYMTGLYGYVKNKVISTRKTWRVLFYINLLGLSLSLLSFLLTPTQVLVIDFMLRILISIPLLVALYKYSSPENDIWNNTKLAKKIEFLSEVFKVSPKVYCNSFGMGTNIRIVLECGEDEFSAQIEKGSDDNIERFSNTFNDLEALVGFIESNTTADIYAFK